MASHPVFRRRPDVIGHRGLGKGIVDGHVENSLASVRACVDAGVDWVEVDVSRSADGELVVTHNPAADDGMFVVGQNVASLQASGLATLTEVLSAVPADVGLDLDLKPVLEDAVTEWDTLALLLPTLRREVSKRRLLLTSFDAAALATARDEVPGLHCGLLTWLEFPLRIAVPMAARLGVDVVGLHHRSFGPNDIEPGPVHHDVTEAVELAHKAGLEVLAWCPGADDVETLVDAGVDAVVVNDVPTMVPLVRGLAGR